MELSFFLCYICNFFFFLYIGNDENFIKARALDSQRKTATNMIKKLTVNLIDCHREAVNMVAPVATSYVTFQITIRA